MRTYISIYFLAYIGYVYEEKADVFLNPLHLQSNKFTFSKELHLDHINLDSLHLDLVFSDGLVQHCCQGYVVMMTECCAVAAAERPRTV